MLDYPYFKENYKIIAIDLKKQEVLDPDPRAIQQISFTANLDWAGNTTMLFIIVEAKENIFRLFTRNCKCIAKWFNFYWYKMTQCNSLNIKLSN